jgi:hypothetical protein
MGRAGLVAGGLLLSACAGDRQIGLPSGVSQPLPATARHGSWMSPSAKTADLLVYIADGQEVDAYDYKTHALLGHLAIDGANTLCSDKSGNIWTSTSNRNGSQMLEYAPGGTQPIAELFSYAPIGCAVDPKSGDLAVVTGGDATGKQNLEIYHQAQGLPQTYSYTALRFWNYCAYDNNGNIVIQGYARKQSDPVAYAELQNGHTKLIPVDISTTDADTAGIQWDGKYFLVGYNYDNTLHRYSVHDGQATEIDEIQLAAGQLHLQQFWLHHDTLVAVTAYFDGNDTVGGFPYPAGSPEENAYSLDIYPYAITVTAKPQKR